MPNDNTAVAVSNRSLATMPFEDALEAYTPNLASALPPEISVDHFKRMVITALNANPDLRKADRRTLFNACVKCASDGLLPDGREAALVTFKNEAVYMPMVAGIRKRLRNSGEVVSAISEVVYRNDRFRYQLGDSPLIEHEPAGLDHEPGEPVGAYAIISLKSGEKIFEVMRKSEIEASRSKSRAPNSIMWKDFWGEAARKTVLRRASKSAPQASAMLLRLLDRDDEDLPPATQMIAPPRPTRQQFIAQDDPADQSEGPTEQTDEPEKVEDATTFAVVDGEGEVHQFDEPEEAADKLLELISAAGTDAKAIEALRVDNADLLPHLVLEGREDLAAEIKERWAATTNTTDDAPDSPTAEPAAKTTEPVNLKVDIIKTEARGVLWGATKDKLLAVIRDMAVDQAVEFRKVNRLTLGALSAAEKASYEDVIEALEAKANG